ncbi:MAG: hypothetical protein ABWY06_23325 [Pseudomonas sp.]|uniref:hypothetical protein n=1 Tax=Pseudomonas sp. TaxID=306 RepID=UPI0033974481
METRVYANKGWQHIGKVAENGKLYAEGMWCFRTPQREDRTCDATGAVGSRTNYWPTPVDADDGCPYKGANAYVGQLVMRNGENGAAQGYSNIGFAVEAGMDLWMSINDDYFDNNEGHMDLRFVSSRDSQASGERILSDAEKRRLGLIP